MIMEPGTIRLEAGPRENRNRPSIDALFRSAAQAYGSQVIGVVVTGNLDDGSAGLLLIKNRGGLAIVQDPEEAMAPSMPSSAMEITEVDFVLPAGEIGSKLMELAGSDSTERILKISPPASAMASTGQTYACPECGGVLEEAQEGQMLRFRCRVGHMYSPDSLLADKTVEVERALWAAIRSLEEQAEFSERLATNSERKHRPRLAKRFSEKAGTSREEASLLRELLYCRRLRILCWRFPRRGPVQTNNRVQRRKRATAKLGRIRRQNQSRTAISEPRRRASGAQARSQKLRNPRLSNGRNDTGAGTGNQPCVQHSSAVEF
jgi:two-component system chemotaxis response regulator CheB